MTALPKLKALAIESSGLTNFLPLGTKNVPSQLEILKISNCELVEEAYRNMGLLKHITSIIIEVNMHQTTHERIAEHVLNGCEKLKHNYFLGNFLSSAIL